MSDHEQPAFTSSRGLGYWGPLLPALGGQVEVHDSSLAVGFDRDGGDVHGPVMWLRLYRAYDDDGRIVFPTGDPKTEPASPAVAVQLTPADARALIAKVSAWLARNDDTAADKGRAEPPEPEIRGYAIVTRDEPYEGWRVGICLYSDLDDAADAARAMRPTYPEAHVGVVTALPDA